MNEVRLLRLSIILEGLVSGLSIKPTMSLKTPQNSDTQRLTKFFHTHTRVIEGDPTLKWRLAYFN